MSDQLSLGLPLTPVLVHREGEWSYEFSREAPETWRVWKTKGRERVYLTRLRFEVAAGETEPTTAGGLYDVLKRFGRY